jgi:eukaryotic-like serine/threonine-protein kinase
MSRKRAAVGNQESAIELREGTLVGGDFKVVAPLRRGGMAMLYSARQVSTGRMRALKVPRAGTPLEAARDDFRYEAQVTARIESAHVVDVIGAGVDAPTGMPFIAMELLRGEDLGRVVAQRGRLSLSHGVELMRHLGHALGNAHELGIVHRDLKPENVFLGEARHVGAPFTAKVIDFGAARRCVGRPRRQTRAIGSPLFMSPEQTIERATIDQSTDVWALGLVAFFAVTGRSFWKSTTMEGVLDEVLVAPIPAASERARELGVVLPAWPDLDHWFARCLDRNPERRFPTAGTAAGLFVGMADGERRFMPSIGVPPTRYSLDVARDLTFESGTWRKPGIIISERQADPAELGDSRIVQIAKTDPAPPFDGVTADVAGGIR